MATVTKLDAAERLIVTGIVMLERGDDPLAVHVVAASALNMLRELIHHGGDNYVTQVLKQGLFHAANAELSGKPITLPTNTYIEEMIDRVVVGIKDGEFNGPAALPVEIDTANARKLLDYIIAPFNFLKHAQRDPLATLDESDVDPKSAIMHALTAYGMLAPGKPLPNVIERFLMANDLKAE